MDPILIFGHRNPDTDTICSAIALAELKNLQGENAVPCRLGDISRETRFVLNKFGFDEPRLLKTVSAQISDIENMKKVVITINDSFRLALDKLTYEKISSLPVVADHNKLIGMLNISDIANAYLNLNHEDLFRKYKTTYENLLEVLQGQVISGSYPRGTIEADLKEFSGIEGIAAGDIVVLFAIDETIDYCIRSGARVIIAVCDENDYVSPRTDVECAIIVVKKSLFKVIGLIGQSISISSILKGDSFFSFKSDDFLHDIRDMMKETSQTNFPVTSKDGTVYGTIRMKNLVNFNKKRVILVDHNEKNQSVAGIEDARIVQVVDHHKFANFMTDTPVNITAQIVGSTCTIVYGLYKEAGLRPRKEIAGLLLSGIISDTLLLKSPTCTPVDIQSAHELERLIEPDTLNDYGLKMLEAGATTENMSALEILTTDLKEFPVNDYLLGVAQINTTNPHIILQRQQELEREMNKLIEEKGYSLFILVITDIIKSGSYLLVIGDYPMLVEMALDVTLKDHVVWLDGVISRKKQIIPPIMETLEKK